MTENLRLRHSSHASCSSWLVVIAKMTYLDQLFCMSCHARKMWGDLRHFISCLQAVGLVHWDVIQSIEVHCKGNGEFDKMMVLRTYHHFWC